MGAPVGNQNAVGHGAPVGNDNNRRGKLFKESLRRALAKVSEDGSSIGGLDKVASTLVRAALAGEQWAVQEIANRFDGKPAQSLTIGQDDEAGPIQLAVIKVPYKELHDVGTDA